MKKFFIQLLIAVAILGGWLILYQLKIFHALLVPSPQQVFFSLLILFSTENIANDLWLTFYRMLASLAVGLPTGIIIGLALGYFKTINKSLNFLIDFVRSIPSPALIPPFILLFGLTDLSKILLAAFISALVILINTIYGVHNGNKTRIMFAKSLKLNKLAIFLKVILPEALPYISAGARVAISYSLIIIVIGEMLMGGESGLGKRIIDFQLIFETSKMYAAIILAGLLGYAVNKLYVFFETKTIHWAGK